MRGPAFHSYANESSGLRRMARATALDRRFRLAEKFVPSRVIHASGRIGIEPARDRFKAAPTRDSREQHTHTPTRWRRARSRHPLPTSTARERAFSLRQSRSL